jgi:hypothetical protein
VSVGFVQFPDLNLSAANAEFLKVAPFGPVSRLLALCHSF